MHINIPDIRLYKYLRNLLQISFMSIFIYLVWYIFNFKFSFTGFERWPLFKSAVSKKPIYNSESQDICRFGIPLNYHGIILPMNTPYDDFLNLFFRVST